MASFKDGAGVEWRVSVTVGSLGKVKADADVDLGSLFKTEKAAADLLFTDPGALVRVLWVLCEDQATKAGVTPEKFAFLFDGPTLEGAAEALIGAMIDFFPRSRVAQAMKAGLARGLTAMDEKLTAAVEVEMDRLISNNFAGNSPAPSASIPTA